MNISANFATGPVIGQKITNWIITEMIAGNYIPLCATIGITVIIIGSVIAYAIHDNKKNPTNAAQ